ncbi:MAG: patatin-like phospholipase family protein [Hyphomonadaceae bacterium]
MSISLSRIPFFKDCAPEALAAAEAEAEWYSLPGGWALFQMGEEAQGVYFLLSGALAAFRTEAGGEPRLIGYIRPNEPVGEMAMVSGEAHSASVYAIRDSEVVHLSRALFDRLILSHPTMMEALAKIMLARSRPDRRRSPRQEPKVFALLAASPTIDLRLRARALQAALARIGKTACIVGEEGEDMLSAWFDELERDHDAVLLVSAIGDTPWFRTCLRQADRIWVLARSDARPSIPLLPNDPSPARRFQLVDIVMLHHGGAPSAASSALWRAACDAQRLFHWNGLDDIDAQRLARIIAGQSVGLVLSGGGARAYAHIGVVRALREAEIPIDMVGGTSMGAIVAACVAMGWSDEEIEVRIRKAFVESNPLGDYMLPVVALSAGRRVSDRLQEHFGETLIEDLRTPFFAVSTNLLSGASVVHRAGLLRDTLRATIALPGILPPVVIEPDQILVDGAVMKNFPVDVMREFHRGAIIGVDAARVAGLDIKDYVNPPKFFQWVALHGLQTPPPIASLLIRAATITLDPWQGRDATDLLIVPEMENVDLRDWKMFDEAVVSGYDAAVAALKAQPAFGKPQPAEPGGALHLERA